MPPCGCIKKRTRGGGGSSSRNPVAPAGGRDKLRIDMERKKRRFIIGFLLFSCGFVGLVRGDADVIQLPDPSFSSDISVEEALNARKAVRSFLDEPIEIGDLSQLLWAACGKKVDGVSGASRTIPSAGALYPIKVYAIVGNVSGIAPGIYLYNWRNHTVELVKSGDYRESVSKAGLFQRFIRKAPLIMVVTAVSGKTSLVYGNRGSTRYVHMEAGHSAQNIYLQAAALNLGTVTIGAFDDDKLKAILEIRREETLYIMPVGKPGR